MKIILKKRAVYVFKSMVDTFLKRQVARSAAALSYYLTLSVFPFLVCVSAVLGRLHLYDPDFIVILAEFVPHEVMVVVTDLLNYVSENQTTLLLIIGLTAMVTSSSAAFRSFIGIMGEIQGKMRFAGIWGGLFSFVFSVVLLVAVYASVIVIASGGWLMQILRESFGLSGLFAMWTWIRFVLLFLLLFGIIFGMYIISAPRNMKKTQRLPGAAAASVVMVIVSIIYSQMISVSIRYTILYGSLASFVILMIWLYTCGIILIMGNVFNISLREMRNAQATPDYKSLGC